MVIFNKKIFIVLTVIVVITEYLYSDGKNLEKVVINIDKEKIINDQFKGIGVQGDLFLWLGDEYKVSKEEEEMIIERVRKVNPSIVRLFLMTRWWNPEKGVYEWESIGMKNLYKVLELYKSIGAEVILTVWRFSRWINPGVDMNNAVELSTSVAKLVKHLIRDKGFENIKYLIIYNEPDLEFRDVRGKSSGYRDDIRDYRKIYELLDSALRGEGVRNDIKLMGPDDALSTEWFCETVEMMDDLIDVYDSHHYETYDARAYLSWLKPRVDKLREKNINKLWYVTEFGMLGDGRETFDYGLYVGEVAAIVFNNGASSLLIWTLQSNPYPGEGGMNDWGLWRYLDTEWQIRPVYYSYSILTRNFRPGMKVIKSSSNSDEILTLSMISSDNKVSIMVVNRGRQVELEINCKLEKNSSFFKYLYNKKIASNMFEGNLIEPKKININQENKLVDKLDKLSLVLYVQE